MYMEIIGRKAEKQRLETLFNSDSAEFLVVYGRRRVGKTFLIRQHFQGRLAFVTTGMYKQPQTVQLLQFAMALAEYFDIDTPTLRTWIEAFAELRKCLKRKFCARAERFPSGAANLPFTPNLMNSSTF